MAYTILMRIPCARMILLGLSACGLFPARAWAGETAMLSTPRTARQHGLWELDFQCEGVPHFDPAEAYLEAVVETPSGKLETVPAFWMKPFFIPPVATQELEETPPHWRVRYCPVEAGQHQVRLVRVGKKALIPRQTIWEGSFEAQAASSRGFLRRDPGDAHYLRFEDGTGFFALGFNVAWPPSGGKIAGYLHYLDRLREAGCNYTRVWLCTWGFALETPDPYDYDLYAAAELDALFREADARGIYVKLCIDNFHDFLFFKEKGPYFGQGKPCSEPEDFFAAPGAKAIYQAKLRYLVARYGAYTSLLGWEFWNEMDYTLNPPLAYQTEDDPPRPERAEARREYYLPWIREMGSFLRKLDPYRHPLTTSLGNHVLWDRLWDVPELDIVEQHSYIPYLPMSRTAEQEDAALFILNARAELQAHGKPYLMDEFGYLGTNEDNPLNDLDTRGIALHNALWSGALSGYAGTPMLWWWDYYLEEKNLYSHYAALSRFLEGADWSRQKSALYSESDPEVRVVGLQDPAWIGLWVQNKSSTWYLRLVEEEEPAWLDNISLAFSGISPGTYRLEWFDPYEGRVRAAKEVRCGEGRLEIEVPAFSHDIAARLFLQSGEKGVK
ncbi:MAG: hypothetical protein V1918_03565 [Planctomycetota bacterium]